MSVFILNVARRDATLDAGPGDDDTMLALLARAMGAGRAWWACGTLSARRSQIDLLLSCPPPALLALEPPDVLAC